MLTTPLGPRSQILVGTLLALALGLHLVRAYQVNSQQPSDFRIFYDGSFDAWHGLNPYRTVSQHLPYIYPPLLLWICTPLTLMPLLGAVEAWTVINFVAWLVTIRRSVFLSWSEVHLIEETRRRDQMGQEVHGAEADPAPSNIDDSEHSESLSAETKSARSARTPIPWVLWVLPSLLCYRFILRQNLHGQADLIVVALTCTAFTLVRSGREVMGGVIAALAVTIKPLPILILPYFLVRRRYWAFMATITGTAFLLLLPAASYGLSGNTKLLSQWLGGRISTDLTDVSFEAHHSNQSIQAVLYRWMAERATDPGEPWPAPIGQFSATAVNSTFLVIAAFFSATFLALCAWRTKRSCTMDPAELALLWCVTHLISRRTLEYHLVSLVLIYTVLIAGAISPTSRHSQSKRFGVLAVTLSALIQNLYSPLFVSTGTSLKIQCMGPIPLSMCLIWAALSASLMSPPQQRQA